MTINHIHITRGHRGTTRLVEKHVYGGVYHARLDYVRERHGVKGLHDLFKKAVENGYKGPKDRKEFKLAKPYPLDDLLIIFKTYIELYGESDFDNMAREAAKRRGIIGFFVKWAASPDLLLKKAQEYWPKFYDFGRLEGEVTEKNKGFVRGHDVSPEPLFCRSLTHYFIGIMENLRLKKVQVKEVKCIHFGSEHCEWEFFWEK